MKNVITTSESTLLKDVFDWHGNGLAAAVKNKSNSAEERLLRNYITLRSESASWLVQVLGVEWCDAEQEVCQYILEAAHAFEPDYDGDFERYVRIFVTQSCKNFVRASGLLMGMGFREFENGLKTIAVGSCRITDFDPLSASNVLKGCSSRRYMTSDMMRDFVAAMGARLSAGAMDVSSVLEEVSVDEDSVDKKLESDELMNCFCSVFKSLDGRSQRVLKLRYGFDGHSRSLCEASAEMGYSSTWIRVLEDRALWRLSQKCRTHPQFSSLISTN